MKLVRYKKVPIPYTRIRELNIWTLSNFLSVLRVLLLPFIYISLFQRTPQGDRWAIGLMLAAFLTDMLDGWMARLRHGISSFGKIIDPLADKICLGALAIFMIVLRSFPIWLFLLIVSRDILIMLTSALLIRRYKIVFPANFWGKIYSFSVAMLISAYTLNASGRLILQLQMLVVVLVAASILGYAIIVYRYIRTHYRHQRMGRRHKPGGPDDDPSDTAAPAAAGPESNRTAT
ncbi:MAG: hypothetical protein A3F83_10020 [Candidatus Glassbacteria bacterium RIFCSPLOWO2_12_FULL_58_11]|uniref:CDP-diacylglycerol--glycerol-3-phosphate 3-phosphatidyltransferase n=1 Tax=Candidatus Glassbacteria bacterium RIFCSPLOWO2_12_FULL_58_11 TaxID=1817867 RepID=A0A1F5Z3W7_9BACT|nr:MAG: hypothetical protein A3F83_10020 [Candidatus Glassbacteria bacterium RIFCSPLOWO2_12_FULL_58_11]